MERNRIAREIHDNVGHMLTRAIMLTGAIKVVNKNESLCPSMERNLRKTRVGIVTSDKMDKTVVVSIKDRVKHPLYKKIVNRTIKLKAHDENNTCGIGDRVLVMETRPMSKDKRWRVVEIIEKAK